MKVTSTRAYFAGTWSVELRIEPGSVPDRPMPQRRIGVYRPHKLRLEFYTSADQEDTAALRLENLKQATEPVSCSVANIYGSRLKEDGTEVRSVVGETFHDPYRAPEWVQGIVQEQLQALGSKENPRGI